jgi:hypothetical protein
MWMVEHNQVDSGELNFQHSTFNEGYDTFSSFLSFSQTWHLKHLFAQLKFKILVPMSRILFAFLIYSGISTCIPLTRLLLPRSFAGRNHNRADKLINRVAEFCLFRVFLALPSHTRFSLADSISPRTMRFPFLCVALTLTLSVSVSACASRFSSCGTSYDCCPDLLCMKTNVGINSLCIENSIPWLILCLAIPIAYQRLLRLPCFPLSWWSEWHVATVSHSSAFTLECYPCYDWYGTMHSSTLNWSIWLFLESGQISLPLEDVQGFE